MIMLLLYVKPLVFGEAGRGRGFTFGLTSAQYLFYHVARVTSPDGDSLWFRILAEIMQGGTLAPYLFMHHSARLFTPLVKLWKERRVLVLP